MTSVISYIKQIILITVMIGAVTVFSVVVNTWIPWVYLTLFFEFFKTVLAKISWFWDIDTLFLIILIVLTIDISLWALRGVLTLINYFTGD